MYFFKNSQTDKTFEYFVMCIYAKAIDIIVNNKTITDITAKIMLLITITQSPRILKISCAGKDLHLTWVYEICVLPDSASSYGLCLPIPPPHNFRVH